jgi:uncharacterized membrane protein YeaQ/YmgE (transglycosylase-associated protein family)
MPLHQGQVVNMRSTSPGRNNGRWRTFWAARNVLLVAAGSEASAKVTNMSIIGWIVLGLIAGFIASKIVNKTGEGVLLDIVLGIVGAVVGGFLFAQFGAEGVTGFNLYSMFVAVIGAIVVLLLYHAVAGRRTTV